MKTLELAKWLTSTARSSGLLSGRPRQTDFRVNIRTSDKRGMLQMPWRWVVVCTDFLTYAFSLLSGLCCEWQPSLPRAGVSGAQCCPRSHAAPPTPTETQWRCQTTWIKSSGSHWSLPFSVTETSGTQAPTVHSSNRWVSADANRLNPLGWNPYWLPC